MKKRYAPIEAEMHDLKPEQDGDAGIDQASVPKHRGANAFRAF